jgi:hypothetical protein
MIEYLSTFLVNKIFVRYLNSSIDTTYNYMVIYFSFCLHKMKTNPNPALRFTVKRHVNLSGVDKHEMFPAKFYRQSDNSTENTRHSSDLANRLISKCSVATAWHAWGE